MRTVRSTGLILVITAMISFFLFLSLSQFTFGRYIDVPPISLAVNDVVIAVKTTQRYHRNRVQDILDTWFKLAPNNTYFVTDTEDEHLNRSTKNKAILSDCWHEHTRWACHFDDDNYVHIAELLRTLKEYNPAYDWYLGKPSTLHPVNLDTARSKVDFWFATGGAGFCLSRSLLTKMSSYIRNGGFELLGEHLKLPDDITLGYLINHLLNVNLTVVQKFHSHLESLHDIPRNEMHKQISFSAGSYKKDEENLVDVPELYEPSEDPQRFRSLHCFLYGEACHQKLRFEDGTS